MFLIVKSLTTGIKSVEFWRKWFNLKYEEIENVEKVVKSGKLAFLTSSKCGKIGNLKQNLGYLTLWSTYCAQKNAFSLRFSYLAHFQFLNRHHHIWKHFLKQSHVNNYHIM